MWPWLVIVCAVTIENFSGCRGTSRSGYFQANRLSELSTSLLEVDYETRFRDACGRRCWRVTNANDTGIHRLSWPEGCQSAVKVIHGAWLDIKLLHVDIGGRPNIDAALDKVLELLDVIAAIANQRCRYQWVAGYMECFSGICLRLATYFTLDGKCHGFR